MENSYYFRRGTTIPPSNHGGGAVSLQAFGAYDFLSVEALVRFFHAAAGYPVKAPLLKAIKAWCYHTLPGLTYSNANKYCPAAVPTTNRLIMTN